jgi:hypothetical protein
MRHSVSFNGTTDHGCVDRGRSRRFGLARTIRRDPVGPVASVFGLLRTGDLTIGNLAVHSPSRGGRRGTGRLRADLLRRGTYRAWHRRGVTCHDPPLDYRVESLRETRARWMRGGSSLGPIVPARCLSLTEPVFFSFCCALLALPIRDTATADRTASPRSLCMRLRIERRFLDEISGPPPFAKERAPGGPVDRGGRRRVVEAQAGSRA